MDLHDPRPTGRARPRASARALVDEVLERVSALVSAGQLRAVGLDATPAGRGLYLKHGFQDGPALVRLRAEAAASAEHGPASPPAASELDAILERDRAVFGADRSPVLRALAGAAPELTRIAWDGGHVRGYCFGRHGDHADHLGPVVADDEELARELVLSVLAATRRRPLILDARAASEWLAALRELGFREQRPLTRMYLGEARPAARPERESAILGPEFG